MNDFFQFKYFIGKISDSIFKNMKGVNEYHIIRSIKDYSKIKEISYISDVILVSIYWTTSQID